MWSLFYTLPKISSTFTIALMVLVDQHNSWSMLAKDMSLQQIFGSAIRYGNIICPIFWGHQNLTLVEIWGVYWLNTGKLCQGHALRLMEFQLVGNNWMERLPFPKIFNRHPKYRIASKPCHESGTPQRILCMPAHSYHIRSPKTSKIYLKNVCLFAIF